MSDFDVRNIPQGPEPIDEPVPFDDEENEDNSTEVSHSPLTLGPQPVKIPETPPDPQPAEKPAADRPLQQQNTHVGGRITGCRTFFTKLHPGAIDFLDGQITEWLKKNPSINIKSTNSTVGEVQAKKTEPNLIVTVWY